MMENWDRSFFSKLNGHAKLNYPSPQAKVLTRCLQAVKDCIHFVNGLSCLKTAKNIKAKDNSDIIITSLDYILPK